MISVGSRFVFFDLETGGLDVASSPIIQIAAVATDTKFRELDSIEMKVAFSESDCSPLALAANGYAPAAWVGALDAHEVRRQFSAFLRRHATIQMESKRGRPYYLARLAGYNVAAFDCPMIQRWYKDAGEFFAGHYQSLDVYQLALWVTTFDNSEPTKLDLSSLMARYGIERVGDAHEALSDVRASVAVARVIAAQLVESSDVASCPCSMPNRIGGARACARADGNKLCACLCHVGAVAVAP